MLTTKTRLIASEGTLALRHHLLRPNQPLEASRYPNDDAPSTFHLGDFFLDSLIGIASFYQEPLPGQDESASWRLRGMAVEPQWQRKGVGRDLIRRGLDELKQRNASVLWCNARVSALEFYEALGFATVGEAFELPEIGWHYVMIYDLTASRRV